MRRTLLLLAVLGVAFAAHAQENPPAKSGPAEVSVAAKGLDVRGVLSAVFEQAGKDFVLEPNIRFVLYLSLTKVEFEEALQIICKTAELKWEVQNGVYFITKKKVFTPPPAPEVKPVAVAQKKAEPLGKLPADVLSKTLTTRLSKTDFREVIAAISKQTGVTIEVGADVPRYKVDAFLIGTSLKYALDVLTKAMGTTYTFTERRTIMIGTVKDENRVVVIEH
ncbi:MAG: hypothetical protein K1X67_09205 [Fimbriimonadaceae bacterium]|nr:hypothetical protein [Fimbriimonadaceae bacterium]